MNTPSEPYLSNRELLAEIHKSKLTFCSFLDPAHANHDAIVFDRADITPELIEVTRVTKAVKLGLHPDKLPVDQVVFRVMTGEHVPMVTSRTQKTKQLRIKPSRTSFPPFKHVIVSPDGLVEVLRSHWLGGFDNGHFTNESGRITPRLAKMMMMLVDRYAKKRNWRDYSYRDEMKAQALVQLSQVGLQFNEAKSDNPFSFYTTTIHHAFIRVWNAEKKVQNIRDDLWQDAGWNPSYARQDSDSWDGSLS